MSLIFVHGVNVRAGAEYDRAVVARNRLLRHFVLEPLAAAKGAAWGSMEILSPYWGGDGVSFAWKNATLPQATMASALGSDDSETPQSDLELASLMTEARPSGVRPMGAEIPRLKAAALNDLPGFAEAVVAPLIFSEATVAEEGQDAKHAGELEAAVLIAVNKAAMAADVRAAIENAGTDDEVIEILEEATTERLENLLSPADEQRTGVTAMGPRWDDFVGSVSELFERAKGAPGRVASVAAVSLLRDRVNANLGQFLGDVFVYLKKRGDKSTPGPIVQRVIAALTAEKRAPDEPTIVVTHSMGGNVVYDALTYYRPDISVDAWISVGGQVGLFEEMKLFQISDPAIVGPAKVKSLRPPLRYWLNVYDPADILSYKVSPVFASNDKDIAYSSGSSTLSAHGSYFLRPSFYHLIAEELTGKI